ncbi:UDP-N-acetylmuramyl-tripeptide synthetase [Natranaerovirga pectinivora]|uniref:UDP-N-acetylmuramyl-tripeptide synthetase n=1 Tax=Natranaerovirga pectinivora TaxID=682400 RepID=A0A4R3MMS2_9FIRM|nr:Mur ligase family protein [Natranaerovirga pectinivora]TCT16273.1 UDP-N-acetylmuramyl-tripeptide synthetase [Natranaerovirga pectinivora]
MNLDMVMSGIEFTLIQGQLDIEINGIYYDSREVLKETAFVAISGFTVDGHNYIHKATENGANTLIVEKDVQVDGSITVLKVKDCREVLGKMASNYYKEPSKKINLIGVTGTKGKTNTTNLIKDIFDQAKKPIGLIGTKGTIIGNTITPNQHTTPESLKLHKTFSDMLKQNIEFCVMEVSSHALELKRVFSCYYNTAIFTNLYEDHLDFHSNMEAYFNTKAQLFEMTTDYNIINIDDDYGKFLSKIIKNRQAALVTFGCHNDAVVRILDIQTIGLFTKVILNTPIGCKTFYLDSSTVVNIYNNIAAMVCGLCYGIAFKEIENTCSIFANKKYVM